MKELICIFVLIVVGIYGWLIIEGIKTPTSRGTDSPIFDKIKKEMEMKDKHGNIQL